MNVLSIDPGPSKSAWVLLVDGVPVRWGWEENEAVVERVGATRMFMWCGDTFGELGASANLLAIEWVQSYGRAIGKDVFETCYWVGRFAEAFGGDVRRIPRPEVGLALCGDSRAKDKHIREACIDRFGGREKAIGGTKCPVCKGKGWVGRGRPPCPMCADAHQQFNGWDGSGYVVLPGPLYMFSHAKMSTHGWAALAVGLVAQEQE